MRAGTKDRRIEIQALTTSKDTYGAEQETWALYKEVWANVQPVRGDERFSSDQLITQADSIFRIDYISGLSTKTHRIKYLGNVYDILFVAEIGRHEVSELTARLRGV